MTRKVFTLSYPMIALILLLGILLSACGSVEIEASSLDQTTVQEPGLSDNAGGSSSPDEPDKDIQGAGTGEHEEGEKESTASKELTAAESPRGTSDASRPVSDTDSQETRETNPLTGLRVEYPEWLRKRPVMFAISNFPPSSIPHTGESFASIVFELFQGFGMTRNLAIFYGDYAEIIAALDGNQFAEGSGDGNVIGPVRSGRVVFEDVKTLFPKALLITAGASSGVKAQLSNRMSVYGSDPDDINSTGVRVDQLSELADHPVDPEDYVSLTFDSAPPVSGTPAASFRVIYNLYNQIGWQYDPQTGSYLRSHDKADGTGELFPELDRLTGEQLGFENVAILWAQHRYVTETIVEMNLVYVWDQKGLLFRDGQVYSVKWSTRGGKLRFETLDGNPMPLKPGKSFFEVVSWQSTWNTDEMIVRFHEPPRDF
jgi:hypothetical protein